MDRKKGITLKSAVDFAAKQKGLFVADCVVGDVIELTTIHSTYTLTILDPARNRVSVKGGGEDFPEPTETYVGGSSMTGTGSMVRGKWIGAGFRVWLGIVLITEVQSIKVNGELFQALDSGQKPESYN